MFLSSQVEPERLEDATMAGISTIPNLRFRALVQNSGLETEDRELLRTKIWQ